MAAPTKGTERGFDRLVFFSDAVVAIAITLLILPLVDSVSNNDTLSHYLNQHSDRFIAFILSFAVIARFWVAHHSLFERIDKYNSLLLWVNMLWLLSIVFLPFPSELISVRSTSETAVRFIYIATVLLNSAFLLLLQIVIQHSPELWADGAGDSSLTGGIITVLLLVLALIVGTAVPAVGMWAMLFLVAAGPIQAVIERRRGASAR